MMEEERERLARERETMHFQEWERKEEEFHRQQARARTEIRIAKGRARVIDMLGKNLLLDEHFDMEMTEPYKLLRSVSAIELQELLEDMQTQAAGEMSDYWNALIVVCHDELELRESQQFRGGVADHGVHKAVQRDLDIMFQGKTYGELNTLADEVMGHIRTGGDGDVEYWESLMKRLKVHRAKAQLRNISQELLRKRVRKLESQDGGIGRVKKEAAMVKPSEKAMLPPPPEETRNQVISVAANTESGGWSPDLLSKIPEDDEEFVMTEADDMMEIAQLRNQVHMKEAATVSNEVLAAPAHSKLGPTEEQLYRAVADASQGDDGANFDTKDEVQLEPKTYTWHEKYQPRKPRYFNRVHTGFEWNKYNQTHYDHDNPPPKVVQGYKINVFYPDLIDKTVAPEFFITKDPDGNKEVCVLRISAGPPYEDVAFKILNREWEYSHRHGYKCSFERGIFHLCFNFKKHRYRR
eukprot:TRINITY_DN16361_c0_g1_i1.p1 TRINITY_DN16361_c0_g1~~TRINITY_DN16361_c0_g1_i1.p1  ORF type:complete len:467 (-),score=81.17 TRINITY_DN16361_c0_g1_i1:251-1651(-)